MPPITIKSCSPSRLNDYESCPFKAKLKMIDKIPEPERPLPPGKTEHANDRGTRIHEELEAFVRGTGPMPIEARKFKDELERMTKLYKEGKVSLEGEWGFDRDWRVAEWFQAWLRMKLDALIFLTPRHAVVVDYKGLALDTLIPTPTGWTTMGEIKVGDRVFDQKGDECKVLSKSKVKHIPCYEITFDDTTKVVCDEEHLWTLSDDSVVPVTELTKKSYINVCEPIDLPERDLPVHPYVLGLWLADGKHTSGEITKPDDFIWEEIKRCGYKLSHNYAEKAGKGGCRVHTILNLVTQLKVLNVFGNKHIPQMYMRASFDQRLALLQGILDGDGSANPIRKQVVLSSVDPDLSKQYYELICSLGQRCTRAFVLGEGFGKLCVCYPIHFRPYGIDPFRLPRKAEIAKSFGPGRSATRRVKSVDLIPSVPTQCIAVNSADNTFLCTKSFLPTHNSGASFGNQIKHGEQTQLYALATCLKFPAIDFVTTELWYIDQDELVRNEFSREQANRFYKPFDKRLKTMTDATTFPTRPNLVSCQYCPYHPVRGTGHCKDGV